MVYAPSRADGGDDAAHIALLEEQVIRLEAALSSRNVVEQAKGALSVRFDIDADEASAMLRSLARSQGTTIDVCSGNVVASRGWFGRRRGLASDGRVGALARKSPA